jgi:hypothetical protein
MLSFVVLQVDLEGVIEPISRSCISTIRAQAGKFCHPAVEEANLSQFFYPTILKTEKSKVPSVFVMSVLVKVGVVYDE